MANQYGLSTFTSTLTTTRLDQLINGGLEARAKQIVRYYAIAILDLAHELVPVDTGRLQKSLEQGADENVWVEMFGGLAIEFGTSVYYAVFVEFGTRTSHAQPFLGQAVESFRDEWAHAVSLIFAGSGNEVLGI